MAINLKDNYESSIGTTISREDKIDNHTLKKKFGVPDVFVPEEKKTDEELKEERILKGVGLWTSYFRSNPHRFVSEYLKIRPFSWFQKVILFMMFRSQYFMVLASRGIGKSHITALYCVVRCILWPSTKIAVASGVKSQSLEIINPKIQDFYNNFPLVACEISEIKPGVQDAVVNFHNGSWIKIVSAADTARGTRANVIVVDEFRMVKENIIKTVLQKFLTASRRPGFVDKILPDGTMPYGMYEEGNTEIYLSSAWLICSHFR